MTALPDQTRAKRVVVVGDLMTDVIVRPEGPLVRGSDRRAAIAARPGGSGANQAAWLARFGVPVTFVAKVGREDAAAHAAELRRHGVAPVLAIDSEAPSGMLVSIIDPDGERSFLTSRGANDRLDPADLPESLLDGVALLQVSGYALVGARTRKTVFGFLAGARDRGVAISIDPASTAFLEEIGADRFLAWTGGAALCFPNAEEAAALTGTNDPERQRQRLSEHYRLTVIKRGTAGAEAFDGAMLVREGLPSRTPAVVDTTGAGDAFLAGFVATWLEGGSTAACLARAVAAGIEAITQIGGRPPLPD